jgi:hypothetical protein
VKIALRRRPRYFSAMNPDSIAGRRYVLYWLAVDLALEPRPHPRSQRALAGHYLLPTTVDIF